MFVTTVLWRRVLRLLEISQNCSKKTETLVKGKGPTGQRALRS